jgi:ankyrin repeat protein
MAGDPKMVRTLLVDGADPNAVGEDGSSALAIAAYKDPKFVQLLIEHGAEIDLTSGPMIATALASAIYWDQPASARILIESGANPNIADFTGETPLFRVAEKHDVQLARLLLSAEPNVRSKTGKTAIWAAIFTGDVEMIKAFLDAGARVDIRDNNGETALEHAIDFAPEEIVELLQSRGGKQ